MSTRRCVIGKMSDGTYGLRAALPGFDAYSDDPDDANKISFSSSKTDYVQPHAFGIATSQSSTLTFAAATVTWPTLSYTPFAEFKQMASNVVYDDNIVGTNTNLAAIAIFPGGFNPSVIDSGPVDIFWMAYKLDPLGTFP